MEQYPVVVSPQCAPPTGSSQQIPQTIIVSYPKKSNRREHFKDRYALILGIVLILATSAAILFNSIGRWTAEKRTSLQHNSYGHRFYFFPSIWTSIFMYLAGSFFIVASKTKRVGFIITSLVFGIMTAVIIVPFTAQVSSIVVQESNELSIEPWYDYHGAYNENRTQTEDPTRHNQLISLDKAGLALGVLMLICGVVMFASSITLSALCCRVLCCSNKNADVPTDASRVVFLNTLSGVQMNTLSNPQTFTTIGDQAGQAVGGDLPPSYSTSEINKVGLADQEAGECPTKVPI